MAFFYFTRTNGITVSKTAELPAGYFFVDEFHWGPVSLGFIREQNFTADERQDAYDMFMVCEQGEVDDE